MSCRFLLSGVRSALVDSVWQLNFLTFFMKHTQIQSWLSFSFSLVLCHLLRQQCSCPDIHISQSPWWANSAPRAVLFSNPCHSHCRLFDTRYSSRLPAYDHVIFYSVRSVFARQCWSVRLHISKTRLHLFHEINTKFPMSVPTWSSFSYPLPVPLRAVTLLCSIYFI